jgi:hypothetical protein
MAGPIILWKGLILKPMRILLVDRYIASILHNHLRGFCSTQHVEGETHDHLERSSWYQLAMDYDGFFERISWSPCIIKQWSNNHLDTFQTYLLSSRRVYHLS